MVFDEFGYYKEKITSVKFAGKEGAEKISSMIQNLRENPVFSVGDYTVTEIYDYKLGTTTDMSTGAVVEGGLPKSNMIYYQLSDGAWFLVRPSGTEPRLVKWVLLLHTIQELCLQNSVRLQHSA